jgi:hypothetical protein
MATTGSVPVALFFWWKSCTPLTHPNVHDVQNTPPVGTLKEWETGSMQRASYCGPYDGAKHRARPLAEISMASWVK